MHTWPWGHGASWPQYYPTHTPGRSGGVPGGWVHVSPCGQVGGFLMNPPQGFAGGGLIPLSVASSRVLIADGDPRMAAGRAIMKTIIPRIFLLMSILFLSCACAMIT